MTLDPTELPANLDWLESIEKATLRLVVQGIYSFAGEAADIFSNERDDVQDIAEDITREAMDRIGTSIIPVRLFGTMDYKRALIYSCRISPCARPCLWTQRPRRSLERGLLQSKLPRPL
jgi:hypothetical protein